MNYKGGVYTHGNSSLIEFNPWKIVNHAVCVVGYGVDNNVPYW